MSERLVRIGGASGAWGDSPGAMPQLLTAEIDYFVMDYLAEVTMSLLARARMKDAKAGFPPDFVKDLAANLPEVSKRGIRVVTNAGGVNPAACRDAISAASRGKGAFAEDRHCRGRRHASACGPVAGRGRSG